MEERRISFLSCFASCSCTACAAEVFDKKRDGRDRSGEKGGRWCQHICRAAMKAQRSAVRAHTLGRFSSVFFTRALSFPSRSGCFCWSLRGAGGVCVVLLAPSRLGRRALVRSLSACASLGTLRDCCWVPISCAKGLGRFAACDVGVSLGWGGRLQRDGRGGRVGREGRKMRTVRAHVKGKCEM
jgi:hypothetical protein